VPGHAVRPAPRLNGWLNGPLAEAATARASTRRLATGADAGLAGSNGGKVKLSVSPASRSG
jgi:hypothetical protein